MSADSVAVGPPDSMMPPVVAVARLQMAVIKGDISAEEANHLAKLVFYPFYAALGVTPPDHT